MIKINLLPYRNQRKSLIIQQQIIMGLAPIVVVLIVIGCFWWAIKTNISDTEKEIARISNEIKKQQVTMKQITDFKSKKATITKKMEIIRTLQEGKSGPVHVLDELAVNLPGRLWLTAVKQTGMGLNIEGKSLDNISISNYMINLEKSEYFNGVDLKSIKTAKKSTAKGALLKNFVISCSIIYKPTTAEKKES